MVRSLSILRVLLPLLLAILFHGSAASAQDDPVALTFGKGDGKKNGNGSKNNKPKAGTGAGAGAGGKSKVDVGVEIFACTEPNAFALTFDDGPANFTIPFLNMLKANNLKATFFVNCKNQDLIKNRKEELMRMLQDGHQIGSHTHRHLDLTQQADSVIRSEMKTLDSKLVNMIGMSPRYMRPPFFAVNETVLSIMGEMQYHVIIADVDTKDFNFTTPETNDQAFVNFKDKFDAGSISLMHDIHNTTVNQLIPNVIEFFKGKEKKSITVGEFLGDPEQNWYRQGAQSTNPSNGLPIAKKPRKKGSKSKSMRPRSCGCRKGRRGGAEKTEMARNSGQNKTAKPFQA